MTKRSVMATLQRAIMIHNSIQIIQDGFLLFIVWIMCKNTSEVRPDVKSLDRKIDQCLYLFQPWKPLKSKNKYLIRLVDFQLFLSWHKMLTFVTIPLILFFQDFWFGKIAQAIIQVGISRFYIKLLFTLCFEWKILIFLVSE